MKYLNSVHILTSRSSTPPQSSSDTSTLCRSSASNNYFNNFPQLRNITALKNGFFPLRFSQNNFHMHFSRPVPSFRLIILSTLRENVLSFRVIGPCSLLLVYDNVGPCSLLLVYDNVADKYVPSIFNPAVCHAGAED
jgi:hypothetical protein